MRARCVRGKQKRRQQFGGKSGPVSTTFGAIRCNVNRMWSKLGCEPEQSGATCFCRLRFCRCKCEHLLLAWTGAGFVHATCWELTNNSTSLQHNHTLKGAMQLGSRQAAGKSGNGLCEIRDKAKARRRPRASKSCGTKKVSNRTQQQNSLTT